MPGEAPGLLTEEPVVWASEAKPRLLISQCPIWPTFLIEAVVSSVGLSGGRMPSLNPFVIKCPEQIDTP